MKIVKKLLLTKEEEEKLQWAIDWFDQNRFYLEDYGINIGEDYYDIIDAVLMDCEVSEEAEED